MLTCEYCVKLKACSAKVPADVGEKNPEYEGERYCLDFKKVLTNADHIRSMSDDEELAKFIYFKILDEDGSMSCILEWLKKPYKEYRENEE